MIWLLRTLASQSILASIARHGMTAVGAEMMTHPAFHGGDLANAFLGGALATLGIGWSAANKKLNPPAH